MADTKISALTAATTPLAGTEVLPIVQSGTTVKVATNDLTVRNLRANATTGILQVTGPAAASTRVMTVPDASFTAARTDAAQSFTGDQTLSTGNLVIGTSGKGIDFSATPGTGTSELLADYEEGTWTPSLGGDTTYTAQTGTYTKVGRMVTVHFIIIVNVIGTGSASNISGLPFSNSGSNRGGGGVTYVDTPASAFASINPFVQPATTEVRFSTSSVLGAWTDNSSVYASGAGIGGTITYFV
jgi:hypothetical protein